MEARRFDSVPLRARQTPEGFLRDSPVLARSGVQEYRRQDGTTLREYRPASVVFHADVLAMVRGLPIIEDHAALITSANSRQHVIGTVLSEGRADAVHMSADIVIHDPSPVTKGKKELSLAYQVRVDETPGTSPEGEPYDQAVTAITRMDHLAVVPKGRAGVARLNLDASDAVSTNHQQEGGMPDNLVAVRLDGIAYQVPPEVERAITKAQADLTAATTRADGAEAARDAEKARADKAEGAIVQARADAATAARARVGLEAQATKLGATFAQDASDRAVKEAVVKHVRADADFAGKSDAYVDAAFDLAVAEANRADSNAVKQLEQVRSTARADAAPTAFTGNSARDLALARRNSHAR